MLVRSMHRHIDAYIDAGKCNIIAPSKSTSLHTYFPERFSHPRSRSEMSSFLSNRCHLHGLCGTPRFPACSPAEAGSVRSATLDGRPWLRHEYSDSRSAFRVCYSELLLHRSVVHVIRNAQLSITFVEIAELASGPSARGNTILKRHCLISLET